MRYAEPKDRAVVLLRLVLAWIGLNDVSPNPLTFAVFVEHQAGNSGRLSTGLQTQIAAQPRLGDADMQGLYGAHIAAPGSDETERIRGDMQSMMDRIADTAARTGQAAGLLGVGLAGLQGALQVKRVNDTLGHWVGDKVIAGIGEVLRLLPAALRNKLTQQVRLQITVSVGVAAWRPGDDTQKLLAAADGALYLAKIGGRDRVTVSSGACASGAQPPRRAGQQQHHRQRRPAQRQQRRKCGQRQCGVGRRVDGARDHRIQQRSAEQAHHGGVGTGHGAPQVPTLAQRVPERQRPRHQQQPGQEQRQQHGQAARPAAQWGRHRGTQESGEGEQGPGHSLRRAVAGHEERFAQPAWGHHLGMQQRQHHVPAAEYQGTGPVEGRCGIQPG